MYIRFWKDKQLCRVFLLRSGSSVEHTSSEVCLFSYLLGAILSQTSPVSVNACTGEPVPKLSQNKLFKIGVSNSIRFLQFAITQLMLIRSYSVFGQIDFFSILHFLIVTPGGSLELDCILTTLELEKVIIIILVVLKGDLMTLSALYSQAIGKYQLDIPSCPFFVRNYWLIGLRSLTTSADIRYFKKDKDCESS